MERTFRRLRMPGFCPVLFLLFAAAGSGWAEEPAAKQPAAQKPVPEWMVTAECRMIVVKEAAMLALMPELLDDAKIEAASAKLDAMLGKGEAQLAASLLVRTSDGVRGVGATIEEFRYPTEFDPPQVPTELPKENPLEVLKAWPVVGITPTAFETRNMGPSLEIEAVVRPEGAGISVNAVPQHVRFLRWEKYEAGVLANGKHLTVDQPQFFTTKTFFSFDFRNGQVALVGVHKMIEPAGSYELVLLRVSARKWNDAR